MADPSTATVAAFAARQMGVEICAQMVGPIKLGSSRFGRGLFRSRRRPRQVRIRGRSVGTKFVANFQTRRSYPNERAIMGTVQTSPGLPLRV